MLCLFFLIVFLEKAWALEEGISENPVKIEADSIDYDKETETYQARGNVIIDFSGGTLMADTIILKKPTNEVFAIDRVKLITDSDILEGDEVIYNIKWKTGTVYNGKMFFAKNHLYLWGDTIEKKEDAHYHVQNARATSCDGDLPDWQFAGSELDVKIDGYGTLTHGKFLVKGIPIFYTPFFIFPAKTTRQSGFLLPHFAYSRDINGFDVEIPFYWAISENMDATFYQRYMDKRGFKEGLEYRYAVIGTTFGLFYGDYMNDVKQVKETADNFSRNWQSEHKRWSLYLNHETAYSSGFYIRTDIRKVSDKWYFKDFSSQNYYLDHYSTNEDQHFKRVSFWGNESLQALDSTVRLVQNGGSYHLSALARYTDDFASISNDGTLQKYPEIKLATIKQSVLCTPLNFDFNTTYDYYYRRQGQKGHLYDIGPVFSLPVDLKNMFQLTPKIGLRETFWDRDDRDSTIDSLHGNRQVFNGEMSLSTEMYRVFQINGKIIEKMKHGIKPELIYTYIPDVDQRECPDFVEKIESKNALAYALTNTLLARVKEKNGKFSYVEFFRLKLGQDYDIRERRREVNDADRARRPFGDVFMEFDLMPVQYFSFFSRQRFNMNSGAWKQNNYDLVINDPRGDLATLGYRYTQDAVEEINLFLKAVITSRLDATFTFRRNELDQKTLERTYAFNYHKQCWKLEFGLTDTEDDRRFILNFSLSGFGQE
jgi:LPS-assembly protein